MLFACIENSCLPWRMDTALSMMPIFYLGFFYKKVEQKDGWNNKYVSLLLLLIYISIIWFVMSFGYNVNVSVNHYGSPIMFILLAPVGLYVYTHFVKSCNIGAYFSSIGKNTILLYGINLQLIQVAGFVFTKIPLAVNPYFVNTVMCVCATLIGLLISIPINKYLPFVVGNKIKK